jgi:ABC-type nitrate/sulfonate/bicarbonate transport system substrate-binding protein
MKKINRALTVCMFVTATLSVFGFFGCSKKKSAADESSPAAVSGLDKVTFISPTPLESYDYLAIYAGMALGYFKDEGIDLTLIEQTGTDDMKMIASGQAQFGYPSPGVMWSCVDAGITGVKAVCNYDSIQIFGLATNKSSNIKSFADLKGKTIALGADSWTALMAPIFSGAGMKLSDVKFMTYGNGSYEATASGAVPALATWLSEYCQLVGQGYNFGYLDGNEVAPQVSNSLCTSEALIKSNPGLVQRFVNALTKSMYFCYLNVDAAADLTLLHCPNLKIEWDGAHGAAVGDVEQIFGISSDAQKATVTAGIGKFDLKMCQNAADNLFKAGAISKQYTADGYYTNQFAEAALWDKSKIEADAAAYKCSSPQYAKKYSGS